MKDSIAKSREVTAPEIIFDQPLVTSSLSARPAIWWMTMGWEVLSTQWTILEHDSLSFLGTSAVALSQPRSREVQLPVTSIHWCAIFNPRSPLQKEKAVTLVNAIHENDAQVAAKIRKQAELGELAAQVRIVEGYYDLCTGKVEWSAK